VIDVYRALIYVMFVVDALRALNYITFVAEVYRAVIYVIFVVDALRALNQWYSTFFVRVPPHIISLQLCTPKVVGALFKLYKVYNLHLK
jgi:hypothetical protein